MAASVLPTQTVVARVSSSCRHSAGSELLSCAGGGLDALERVCKTREGADSLASRNEVHPKEK